jgi:hypothetical protein
MVYDPVPRQRSIRVVSGWTFGLRSALDQKSKEHAAISKATAIGVTKSGRRLLSLATMGRGYFI